MVCACVSVCMRVCFLSLNFSASFDIQISWCRNLNADANSIQFVCQMHRQFWAITFRLKCFSTILFSLFFFLRFFVWLRPFTWVLDCVMMFKVRKRANSPKEAIGYEDGLRLKWRSDENRLIFDACILHFMCIEYIDLAFAQPLTCTHSGRSWNTRTNTQAKLDGHGSERERERTEKSEKWFWNLFMT